MLFDNNDRPSIMLPEAAQRMIHLWSLKPGEKVLVSGGDDYATKVALDLQARGVNVVGLADFRPDGPPSDLADALTRKKISFWPGNTIVEARGGRNIERAVLRVHDGSGLRVVPCDAIVASAGRTPRHKLLRQSGVKMEYDPVLNFHLPKEIPPGYFAAGKVLGLEDQDTIRAHGRLSAAEALTGVGLNTRNVRDEAKAVLAVAPAIEPAVRQDWVRSDKGKTFVCFCNDSTDKDIDLSLAEGFENIETVKRYTTTTMGSCQGGMCEANFARLLAEKKPDLQTRVLTTPRPPVTPVSFGVMAASHHDNPRMSPLHHLQMGPGVKTKRWGLWIRIDHFGNPEEEALSVRQAAGMCDVSTLGKFRIFGPDAAKLVNRINTKSVDGLEGSKILYTAACTEVGELADDGVVIKRGSNDYYVTTSTARGPAAKNWYNLWHRDEDWRVWVVDLTDTRAGMNLAGPKSREILAHVTDADISNDTLPYMNWAEMEVAEVKALVLRMGFLGELSYEIHCPASQGPYLWKKLLEVGEPFGLKPIGFETQLILRLEKGHVLPGLDTDGFTTLLEAHFGWLWDRTNPDFVGRSVLKDLEGKSFLQQVVGFSIQGRVRLLDGALVIEDEPGRQGYVTSSRYSPVLNQTIGLALVKPHEKYKQGGELTLFFEGREIKARLVDPPFYDPKGERLRI